MSAWFAVIVLLHVSAAHAQVACKLLQKAELESALAEWAMGGKATELSGATDDSSGIVYDTCHSEIVRPGHGNLQVTIVLAKSLPMEAVDLLRNRNAGSAREGQWKVAGARFEEKTIGKAMCTLSGRPNVAAHSVCSIPRGKAYLEVEVIAPSLKEIPSMEAVAALVQKADSRW
jgi:hypothetical protein